MQLVGCSPVPKDCFCVEGHLTAGSRTWRLLGHIAVSHLSSAEGETDVPKTPRAEMMHATCLSISSLFLPPRMGLAVARAAGSGAEADDYAGKNMSSRQNPFPQKQMSLRGQLVFRASP